MTEDRTNERISTGDEDDVEGHKVALESDKIALRSPEDEDDVEGHKLMGTPAKVAFDRSPDDEDDVEGHKLVE